MAIYPGAVVKIVDRFKRAASLRNRVNFHTAVTDASSLYPYFSGEGRPCSHFYVREDGTVEQYVDTRYRAAADYHGNESTISIETWDGYGRVWTSGQPPGWNAAQMRALKRLTLWILQTHRSIPPKLATDSRPEWSSFGLSWHRLGIDPWRHPQGVLYSSSYGKVCPGDARIAQVPEILSYVKTDPTLTEELPDMLIIRRASDGASFIVLGGKGAKIVNTADLSEYRAAGAQTVNLSDRGYSAAQARYLNS
jgi:hypothetical protein